MKKYSFVIPTYQRKVLVKNTLEVLNHQQGFGREDYEVIVVDDGSTDGTGQFINGVNTNYDINYIYLERIADLCRSRPRNVGWKAARGEIIIFIDDDIMVQDNYLKELDRCYQIKQDILVIGNRKLLFKDLVYETLVEWIALKRELYHVGNYRQLEERHMKYYLSFSYNSCFQLYPWLQVFSGNMVVPKKWLEKTAGFDENFKGWGLEDVELGFRLYTAGLNIIINSKLEVFHQHHKNSDNLKINKNKYEMLDKNISYFIDKHPAAVAESQRQIKSYLRGLPYSIRLVPRLPLLVKPIILDFKKNDSLEELKARIVLLSARKGINLIINDYREDTDLDIWIQLLGKRASTPRYYPVSKKREYRRLFPFFITVWVKARIFISGLWCKK